jgi:cyclopropane fatty-acyl-phospholipid synthase-like methyltransferase
MKENTPFYLTEKTAEDYIQLAEGIDGRDLIEKLEKLLPPGSSVLEIGMGPGKDLDILGENFVATGSDFSIHFLNKYRSKNPGADLVLLNAKTMDISDRFDCIYSNKVLHHLKKEELTISIKRQLKVLNKGGLICHSFWKGSGEEEMMGLFSQKYEQKELEDLFGINFDILHLEPYGEMGKDDSLLLIGKLKNKIN